MRVLCSYLLKDKSQTSVSLYSSMISFHLEKLQISSPLKTRIPLLTISDQLSRVQVLLITKIIAGTITFKESRRIFICVSVSLQLENHSEADPESSLLLSIALSSIGSIPGLRMHFSVSPLSSQLMLRCKVMKSDNPSPSSCLIHSRL